jgi:uncharacterized damage-inducible protein DinB
VQAFLDRVENVPNELLRTPPTEGEWSVAELSAHSAEIYGYWAKQIDFLRANPGKPFGRTMADPDRIGFVEQHKNDSLASLSAAIRSSSAEAARALRAYDDERWRTVTGLHSARGEMDMDYISNLFLAGHAEEHLEQLDQTLAALSDGRAG